MSRVRIAEILELLGKEQDCTLFPPNNFLPEIEKNLVMPDDLKEFYKLCGGVRLFESQLYPITIVRPDEFVLANPVIVGERCEEDISANWYIIGKEGLSQFITINLRSEQNGRCYDSFVDRHGIVGECPIIAVSFTDLLERLLHNKGQRWYWLNDTFDPLGDAYDE
ncbi:SMI1/KNR4 family protein [Paenibacillus hamazuiensis]|uniref:SMI1/KNR4 family protein n=1 Tax=Paenibacillus hamazuiensis TaxID=2936508 RepID=UPI003B8454AF